MIVPYVVKDNFGNAGQTISFCQGEVRTVTMFLFSSQGIPLVIPGTISTIVLKIFSTGNNASIQKTLAATQVTAITQAGVNPGLIGFQFALAAADTLSMAANNSGLPMIATFIDSAGNVTQIDFQAVFNVEAPTVVT
jgi:hypothetical protein